MKLHVINILKGLEGERGINCSSLSEDNFSGKNAKLLRF